MDGDIRTPDLWYKSLPTLTRAILTLTFFSSLLGTVGLFNPASIILDWTLVINKFHLWRLITDYFFAGQFGITWLMHIYFFVTFSSKLEVNEMFTVSPGAYLFFLLFQMISLDILSLILFWPYGKPIMAQALVMSIIYYWSRREPYSQIGLWGFTVQAYQFPFALIFLDLILGHSLLIGLMGLLTGHFFYFLRDVLPVEKDIHILRKAPAACDELMLRFSRFDFTNLSGSLKVLLYGISAMPSAPPGAFPRASGSRFGTTTTTTSGSSNSRSEGTTRLFAGEGRRLAD